MGFLSGVFLTYGVIAFMFGFMFWTHFTGTSCEGGNAQCSHPIVPQHMDYRIQIGVLERSSTKIHLRENEASINTTVTQSEYTEIEFNNYTLPDYVRQKVVTPVCHANKRTGKRECPQSKMKNLYAHFQISLAEKVLTHVAYPLLRECDSSSRLETSLLSSLKSKTSAEGKKNPKRVTNAKNSSGVNGSRTMASPVANSEDDSRRAKEEQVQPKEMSGKCWKRSATVMLLVPEPNGIRKGRGRPIFIKSSDLKPAHRYLGIDFFNPIVTLDTRTFPTFHDAPLMADKNMHNPRVEIGLWPVSVGWFTLHRQFMEILDQYEGFGDEIFTDMIVDTARFRNIQVQATGFIISYIHSLLALFAFRNDVNFFRRRKLLTGLSMWTMVGGAMQDVISTLYLYDQPTIHISVVVLAAISSVISMWKVIRVIVVRRANTEAKRMREEEAAKLAREEADRVSEEKEVEAKRKATGSPRKAEDYLEAWDDAGAKSPGSQETVDGESSDEEQPAKTKDDDDGELGLVALPRPAPPPAQLYVVIDDEDVHQYDLEATKYVGSVSLVFFCIYLAYTLKEYEYRSWWSWFITSAAHASYAWGFVLMTPQVYVNYKMKSVAHMPWRSMVYKAFSTFSDDVYAWVIPGVPLAYRLACLRDDVIFIVLVAQLWWYPTDKNRVNEFGQAAKDDEDKKDQEEKEAGGKLKQE